MGTEIFGFRQKLGSWRPFKDGNSHLVPSFATTFFQTGLEIFGFRKKLGPWRPFKDGNSHLVPSFATTFFQTPITWV